MRFRNIVTLLLLAGPVAAAPAALIVHCDEDAGGDRGGDLNGLQALLEFMASGPELTVIARNTSTGVPQSFGTTDSLLVSVAFELPAGVYIVSGDSARIASGAVGLGAWSGRVAGDSVAEQWLWTNDYGGDLLDHGAPLARRQILSTSSGQGGGTETRFGGGHPHVDGPYGGIAAAPPVLAIPGNKQAVSDGIAFRLTLSATLTPAQLAQVGGSSVVEFGSDARYLHARTHVPEPAGLLVVLTLCGFLRRRS